MKTQAQRMRKSSAGRGSARAVAFSLMATAMIPHPALADNAGLPENAKPLSVRAVIDLYKGRSWRWQDGGGYFAEDRKFAAVTGSGKTLMTGSGRWIVTNDGAMCMIADWRDRRAVYKAKKTCFFHARSGKVIYQSRSDGGSWYVFRSDPATPADEYSKLTEGDVVTLIYQTATAKLGQ